MSIEGFRIVFFLYNFISFRIIGYTLANWNSLLLFLFCSHNEYCLRD